MSFIDDHWDPPRNERGELEKTIEAVKTERQKERKKYKTMMKAKEK